MLEHTVTGCIGKSLGTSHGTTPVSLGCANLQIRCAATLPRTIIATETAIMTLSVAQSIKVYLLCPLEIGRITRLLP